MYIYTYVYIFFKNTEAKVRGYLNLRDVHLEMEPVLALLPPSVS